MTADETNPEDVDLAVLKGKHIMVADDIMPMRKIVATNLERMGALVSPCVNGREAYEQLLELAEEMKTPVLLLLDLMMPEMDGFQVMTKLQEHPTLRELPIIITSSRSEKSTVLRCIQSFHVVNYLLKPYKTAKLLETCARAIQERMIQHEPEPAAGKSEAAADGDAEGESEGDAKGDEEGGEDKGDGEEDAGTVAGDTPPEPSPDDSDPDAVGAAAKSLSKG